jgi:NADP-dependent 3-hydroxy acid dehydrogenase YdfG
MSGRVLITGATSGIGRQLALDYRRAGWQVWGCGRDEVRLQALAAWDHPLRFDARDSAAGRGGRRPARPRPAHSQCRQL